MNENSLSFFSLNVRGLNAYKKRVTLFEWLKDSKFDIICLQETHFVKENEFIYNSRWFGNKFHCFSDSAHSRGVTILFKKNLSIEILNYHHSLDGRRLLVNLKYNEKIITIVNAYAPNAENARNDFFKRLITWVSQHAMNLEGLIVCGDFNCQLDSKQNDKSTKTLEKLLKLYSLNDCWISSGKTKINGLSWCDGENIPKSRIDYVFINKSIFLPLCDITLRRAPSVEGKCLSDHLGLNLDLSTSENLRGTGYWKLNNSLLKDKIFCENLRKNIRDEIENSKEMNDPKVRWERLKICIKNFCLSFSKHKSKIEKQRINFVENQLKLLESKHYTEIDMRYKRQLEKEVDDHYEKKCKGAYVRSRALWIEKGEKSNSYFLGLEKKQQVNNTITKVKDENGGIVSDNDNIMKCLFNFYSSLYASRKISDNKIENYLTNVNCQKITNKEKELCDMIPTKEECKEAISKMKNNKSPGQDGLTVEFYKLFWHDIKEIFYASLLQSIDDGMLSFSQRSAVISLIYKKGEKENLKNYRPISLTNVDYKIFANILAIRLQKVADRIIGREQSAYIKGRYIGENARIIIDTFEYCSNNSFIHSFFISSIQRL